MRSSWVSFACIGQPQVLAPRAEVLEYPTTSFTLPNGLGVALEQSNDTGVAGITLIVGVGSADEPRGKAGLAHLTEHLVFRSHSEGQAELNKRLTDRAGTWNGWTTWDTTTYAAYVPTSSLGAVLSTLASVVDDPLGGVDEAEFATELAIVQNERRMRGENGTPGQTMGWLAQATFAAGEPYREPVVGTSESLKAASLADAQAFAQAGYAPGRATLSVSSSLALDEQRRLVEQAFAAIGGRGIAADRAERLHRGSQTELAPASKDIEEHLAVVANPTLWIGFPLPPSLSENVGLARLLAPMINDAFYGNEMARDSNIANLAVAYWRGRRGDLLALEVTLKSPSGAQSAFESVLDRMEEELRKRTSLRATLERYKRYVATKYTYEQESIERRTEILAESMHFFGDPLQLRQRDRSILAIEPEAVQTFVDKYLNAERARAILVLPGPGHFEPVPRQATPGASALVQPIVSLNPHTEAELRSWIRPPGINDVVVGTLSNGLNVVICRNPNAVFHTVLLGFAGGEAQGQVPGVSVAEPWSLIRDSWELSFSGLSGRRYHTPDATIETITSTGSDYALSMRSLMERLEGTQVIWPPREFLSRVNTYEREDASPRSTLEREIWQALFGAAPYGRRPTAEQVHAVRPPDIYRFRNDVLRPENGLLVVVGNFWGESALEHMEQAVGGWARAAKRRPPLAAPPPVHVPKRTKLERDWPHSTRAALSLSCIVDASTIQRAVTLQVLSRLIENRLFDQLRSQLSASYSATPHVRMLRGGVGLLEFESDVSYDQLPAAQAVIDGFVQEPAARTFLDAEVANARRAFAASYNLWHSTTESLATALFRHHLLGFPIDEFNRMPDHLFAVTTDDVNAMAGRCAQHAITGRLGDLAGIAAAYRRAPVKPEPSTQLLP